MKPRRLFRRERLEPIELRNKDDDFNKDANDESRGGKGE